MLITEADLGPYRIANGKTGTDTSLPFIGWGTRYLRVLLPNELFTPSWEIFQFRNCRKEDINVGDPTTLEIVLLLAFTESVPVLSRTYQWMAIEHQGGGISTRHPRFIATQLTPRPSVYPALCKLARDRWFAHRGNLYQERITAEDIATYHNDLIKIGVNCDYSYPHLIESVYPIDATQANLDVLAEDAPRLERITVPPTNIHDRKNLAMFVLTDNSD